MAVEVDATRDIATVSRVNENTPGPHAELFKPPKLKPIAYVTEASNAVTSDAPTSIGAAPFEVPSNKKGPVKEVEGDCVLLALCVCEGVVDCVGV